MNGAQALQGQCGMPAHAGRASLFKTTAASGGFWWSGARTRPTGSLGHVGARPTSATLLSLVEHAHLHITTWNADAQLFPCAPWRVHAHGGELLAPAPFALPGPARAGSAWLPQAGCALQPPCTLPLLALQPRGGALPKHRAAVFGALGLGGSEAEPAAAQGLHLLAAGGLSRLRAALRHHDLLVDERRQAPLRAAAATRGQGLQAQLAAEQPVRRHGGRRACCEPAVVEGLHSLTFPLLALAALAAGSAGALGAGRERPGARLRPGPARRRPGRRALEELLLRGKEEVHDLRCSPLPHPPREARQTQDLVRDAPKNVAKVVEEAMRVVRIAKLVPQCLLDVRAGEGAGGQAQARVLERPLAGHQQRPELPCKHLPRQPHTAKRQQCLLGYLPPPSH
mmetsp:Transcript_30205/g.93774  ORF Transcript_30205/g.93774 Transcript_30205/m.93774 type:complete len:397 (+) Transcript_30205:123-1313(+)